MKLSLDRKLNGSRGPQRFGNLLLGALRDQHGVKIVEKGKKSDIHFLIINGSRKQGAKNVVRLDGIYYDVKRLNMNNSIRGTIKKMDGVVYQSKWCQTFVETMLKIKPKCSTVIYNGTDQSKFKNPRLEEDFGFDKIFLACSHWRVNKRLKSIIRSFLQAREESDKNLGLFVVGEADHYEANDGVLYYGTVEDDRLYGIYKSADYMCHICHLDACPNVVVEGLSAGLPVLCNNIGGTPEIVGNDGIILELDKPFNFKAIKNMAVVGAKSVDNALLTQGILDMTEWDWSVSRPDLDISVSAKKYYEFFKSLLG